VLPGPMIGSLAGVFIVLLWITLFLSSVVLIFVVLIQEGKGGGLAAALGGAGAEAFGVKAGGINRFTAIIAAVFLLSAILLAAIRQPTVTRPVEEEEPVESRIVIVEPVEKTLALRVEEIEACREA
jgi:protein translocase SecG subunit